MHFSTTVASAVVLAGTGLVNAQMTPPSSSMTVSAPMSTGTGSAGQKVHVVSVSNANVDLTFSPADIRAAVGDMVQFQFFPLNHSVVQSTFDQPCQPINNNDKSAMGFFSGFMPVARNATSMPTFTITVNDTKPIWYYCSQGRHCQQGMVGVINPPAANTSRTLESFKALAAGAPNTTSPAPGGASGDGNGTGSGSFGGSGSGSGSNPTSTAGATGGSGSTGTSAPGATSTGAGHALRIDPTMVFGVVAAGTVALVMGLVM